MKETKAAAQAVDHGDHQSIIQLALEHKESPIPAVQDLERLHQLSPQYVDRTLALVESEAQFRHDRQKEIDRYQHIEQLCRIGCATVVIFFGFMSAIALAYFEAYAASGIVGGATLVGLATAFMGKSDQKTTKENKEKPSQK